MLSKCANPACNKRFRYLREGQLFTFRGLPMADRVSRNFQTTDHWWLCTECAATLTIHFDGETGIRVVPKGRVERGDCIRVASLYQAGLTESYCNRCGRFVGASRKVRPLTVAEQVHRCWKPASGAD